MNEIILLALLATLGTWLMTALGAATVVFFKSPNPKGLNLMLGFASGVMIAASFWSLLQPAIERAEAAAGLPAYIVATAGFLAGALFMWGSDKVVCFAQGRANSTQGMPNERLTTAVGIGLQNFPEGAAVSIPLRREGCSRRKSFFLGQASGMVEPVAGVLGAWLVVYVEAILPFALSFAAGAMILVAVHELIPECQRDQEHQPYFATMGIIAGFAVMMLLDVMLG